MNIDELNKKFEKAPPQDILAWAIETYKPKVALSSSFGATSALLIHMATRIDPHIPILFIDTGFLFKETYAFAEKLTKQYNLNVRTFRTSDKEIEEVKRRLQAGDERCCEDAKVNAMKRSLEGVDCWVAGLRRDQSDLRKSVKIVENHDKGMIKVHPIANWNSGDVNHYMKQHNLPYHPLWEKGYTSIGCEPCTQVPAAGDDDRSGRWAGRGKTECGIHTQLNKKQKPS